MDVIQIRVELEKQFFSNGLTPEMIMLLDKVQSLLTQTLRAGYSMAKDEVLFDEWSNNACLGYALFGAMRLKYSEGKTQELIKSIRSQFDWKTVNEAKDAYNKSQY